MTTIEHLESICDQLEHENRQLRRAVEKVLAIGLDEADAVVRLAMRDCRRAVVRTEVMLARSIRREEGDEE